MTVAPPSDALKSELQDIGATMTDEWLAKAGDNGKKLVEDYQGN
jgi:TRAP-type C4-dicarboxylate transport system substrate-binding protein